MRIVERRVQRVWSQGCGVVLIELYQSTLEVGRLGMRGGVCVGFELVAPRKATRERLKEEKENRHDHHKKNQPRCRAGCGNSEPFIEPTLVDQLAESPEESKRSGKEQERALPDVQQLVVTEFMGENRFNLRRRQPAEQCVEEDDALGGTKAGKVGVAMT